MFKCNLLRLRINSGFGDENHNRLRRGGGMEKNNLFLEIRKF